MNVLVTSSRMPFALDEIRKLGKAGHRVFAADTFAAAPGSHSRWVTEAIITPSPRHDPQRFIAFLLDIVQSRGIDWVVPCFEEVFYIAKHLDEFVGKSQVFAPPLDVLIRLHDKSRFLELSKELGVLVPRTITVRDRPSLRAAVEEFPEYFARATYSRGGVQLLTNSGPLAGALSVDECRPTAENPWIVQEFVRGVDVCTYSIAQHGVIAAHSTYIHPKMLEHAGGIVLESVIEPRIFDIVRRYIEATGYHGQVSFDFLERGDEIFVVECNPRATAGVTMMPSTMFVEALFSRHPVEPMIVPAGVRKKMSAALVRDMLRHLREIPSDLRALFSSAEDIYAQPGDLAPALYQLLSYGQVLRYRKDLDIRRPRPTDLAAAYFYDVSYDGQPLP